MMTNKEMIMMVVTLMMMTKNDDGRDWGGAWGVEHMLGQSH